MLLLCVVIVTYNYCYCAYLLLVLLLLLLHHKWCGSVVMAGTEWELMMVRWGPHGLASFRPSALRALGRVEHDEEGGPGRHLLRRQGIRAVLQFFVGLVGWGRGYLGHRDLSLFLLLLV